MIEIVEIGDDVRGSSAIALHAICSDGMDWILRLKKKDKNARRLVNEFIAAGLARQYGLNRPKAELAQVTGDLIPSRHEEIFAQQDQYGVALEFIYDIKHVSPPKGYNLCLPNFAEINRNHLKPFYEMNDNLNQLYAYFVFASWIQLEDNHKYENLLLDRYGNFVFLDMDLAFGGADNKCEMKEYQWNLIRPSAPFLEGIINDRDRCEIWLSNIKSISLDHYNELITEIRGRIEFTDECVSGIGTFLFDQKNQFLSEFESASSDWTF